MLLTKRITLLTRNSKLRKSEGYYAWGLPHIETCPKAGLCKRFCYAGKGFYNFPLVKASKQKRLEIARDVSFIEMMIKEINTTPKIKAIRIHDSGDFFNQTYLNKWTYIASVLLHIKFYTYTKSLHLNFKAFEALNNTKVIQSIGGKLDHKINYKKPVARIFKNKEDLLAAGYIDCSENDSKAANKSVKKIGLITH